MFLKTLQFQKQRATTYTTETTKTKASVLFPCTQFAHAQQSCLVPCTVPYTSAVVCVLKLLTGLLSKQGTVRRQEENKGKDAILHIYPQQQAFLQSSQCQRTQQRFAFQCIWSDLGIRKPARGYIKLKVHKEDIQL